MGKRQSSGLLALVLFGVFWLFKKNEPTNHKKPNFFKGGLVTSPSLFLFLLSMESFASAHPCDWKKSQFIAAEQGGCFFFFYSRILRKAFFAGRLLGTAGARSPGEPLAMTCARELRRTEGPWGFSPVDLGVQDMGGQSRRGVEQMLCLLRPGPGI